jgi:predicted ATPase with chaperone activity
MASTDWYSAGGADQELDFGEVKGQRHVKRAVEVAAAAAGAYNILMFGTILRQRLAPRLPDYLTP